MKTIKTTFGIILGMSLACVTAKAQDTHFTHIKASPMMLNPAATGHIDGSTMRISANYRTQWGVLGANLTSTAINFDVSREKLGFGGYIMNYNQADVINNLNVVGSFSYEITESSNRKYHIVTGLQLGLIHRKLNQNNLTFDNQYEDGNFDIDLPSGENFARGSRFMPETAFGALYYNTNKRKVFKPFAGFSIYHLTAPKENLLDGDKSRLPRKWVGNVGAEYKIDKAQSIRPNFLYARQGTAQEIVALMGYKYKFDYGGYELDIDLGYRYRDAVLARCGFKVKDNIYAISYDFNVSSLRTFTRGRNALEFSAIFIPKGRFFL